MILKATSIQTIPQFNDLSGLLQPKWFYDSLFSNALFEVTMSAGRESPSGCALFFWEGMVTSGVCRHQMWFKQWAYFISPELHTAIIKPSEVVSFSASELFSFTTQECDPQFFPFSISLNSSWGHTVIPNHCGCCRLAKQTDVCEDKSIRMKRIH